VNILHISVDLIRAKREIGIILLTELEKKDERD